MYQNTETQYYPVMPQIPVCRPVVTHPPICGKPSNCGIGVISIAILILVALGVIF